MIPLANGQPDAITASVAVHADLGAATTPAAMCRFGTVLAGMTPLASNGIEPAPLWPNGAGPRAVVPPKAAAATPPALARTDPTPRNRQFPAASAASKLSSKKNLDPIANLPNPPIATRHRSGRLQTKSAASTLQMTDLPPVAPSPVAKIPVIAATLAAASSGPTGAVVTRPLTPAAKPAARANDATGLTAEENQPTDTPTSEPGTAAITVATADTTLLAQPADPDVLPGATLLIPAIALAVARPVRPAADIFVPSPPPPDAAVLAGRAAIRPTEPVTAGAEAADHAAPDVEGTSTAPTFAEPALPTAMPLQGGSSLPPPPSRALPTAHDLPAPPGEPGFSIDSRLLGPVSAALTPLNTAGDRLHVQFTVDRPATAALITAGGHRLDLTLSATGMRLGSLAVAVDGRAALAAPQPDWQRVVPSGPTPSHASPFAPSMASQSSTAWSSSGGASQDATSNAGTRDQRPDRQAAPSREVRLPNSPDLSRDRFA